MARLRDLPSPSVQSRVLVDALDLHVFGAGRQGQQRKVCVSGCGYVWSVVAGPIGGDRELAMRASCRVRERRLTREGTPYQASR